MNGRRIPAWLAALAVCLAGCGIPHRQGLAPDRVKQAEAALLARAPHFSPELERQILALQATNVTAQDLRDVLSRTPAPRVVNIHGGIAKVVPRMASFSEFLIGMGYPPASVTNPSDGTYSFSCYESSARIAGAIAWYYEKEELRPLLVGHSQGGMQVVKVLYQFDGSTNAHLPVWNPLTWKAEARGTFVDPLTGTTQSVASLVLPYASAVGAGGLARFLPNQWDMTFRLRTIPDSVEDFTGFCKRLDLLGGDFLGYGSANEFKSAGKAQVRNVWLPTEYRHGQIPDTQHLLDDPEIVEWIQNYRPPPGAVVELKLDRKFAGESTHILWAAEVWYSIKKHWVLELQRLIRARKAPHDGL